jgi:hypothetical protein
VVNVTNRANVNVRLIALKLALCHLISSCERQMVVAGQPD